MYYLIFAIVIVLIIALCYRFVMPANQADLTKTDSLDTRALKLAVISLASSSTLPTRQGRGVSVRLIKKHTQKYFHLISQRCQGGYCLEFENRIYDNFFQIRDKIAYLKSQVKRLNILPHKKYPRIYEFCSLLVKSTGGAVTKEILENMTKEYNEVTPLSQFEINALPLCLDLALMEFIAFYCKKAIEVEEYRKRAQRDSTKKQIDLNSLHSKTYIYFYLKSCDYESETMLDAICLSNDINIRHMVDKFEILVSAYDAAVESAVSTLNNIKVWLSDEYLLNLSPLNDLFSSEEVVYSDCTLATKNVYLYYVAKKARKERKGELALAREIIISAQSKKEDIAKFILPKGGTKAKMRLYISAVLLFAQLLSLPIGFLSGPLWISISLSALFFPSAVAITLMIITELNTKTAFRRFLPRLNDTKSNTLIIFCGLATSKKEIDSLFFSLKTVRYANPGPNFRYGMLLDFPAGKEIEESDAQLLNECKNQFNQLGEDKYNIYIRKRKIIHGQDKYQGWEKKRGALLNLNEYLINEKSEDFSLILGKYTRPEYVITLDSDTMINCGNELVQIMEHPFNSNKNIVSIKAKTNPYTATSAFARLMCGAIGLDAYSSTSAETNYDLFDSANYTGKGIYRLKEYNKLLKDFFPDNKILSHDFIEGAVAGCASAECALDTFPASFSQYLTRSIRWLRGDWQLLPYLLKKVKTRSGEKTKNPISPIAKWHILCNMLFSLLPISVILSVIIALFSPYAPLALLISFGYYIILALNTIRYSIITLKNPLIDLFRTLFNASVLPIIAVYNFCAIILTLLRLIRGKKLLEWAAFAHAKGKTNLLPNFMLSSALIVLIIIFNLHPIFLIISALFLLGVVFISALNLEYEKKTYIPDSFRLKLTQMANDIWGYFKDSQGLVSDNYQEHLNKGFADRTSPTNIGFSIISAISALELGIINCQQCTEAIESVIFKVESMEKWHGHLYNWSDLNGRPLYPKYVSSVDSGNLLACLLVAENYCKDSLKKRVRKIIDQMDFTLLYDKKRELLCIGFNDSLKIYDGHYDLLASEAMLTYLITIGCKKIPKKGFENLSKNALKAYGKISLASWTGGTFEYLMNCIFLQYPSHGMLARSAKAAIHAHKMYAKDQKLPFWGCSESQYNFTDNNGNFQYKAFGVPAISNSNQEGGMVCAPYASMLALCYDGKSVEKNLIKMEQMGLGGKYGLYESSDGNKIIKSFMAHHQGMILASICNYLCENVIIQKLRTNPAIAAAELLMTQQEFTAVSKKKKPLALRTANIENDIVAEKTHPKRVNILTNGKYSAGFDSDGGNFSVYKDKYLSRYEQGRGGLKIYFSEIDSIADQSDWDSAKYDEYTSENSNQIKDYSQQIGNKQSNSFKYNFEAAKDFADKSSPKRYDFLGKDNKWQDISQGKITFSKYKTQYEYQTQNFLIAQTAIVLPNINGEMRKIIIKNITNSQKSFMIGSYLEPVLNERWQDLSHKQFSSLKIRTKLKDDVLVSYRNDAKDSLFLAHYFDIPDVVYEGSGSNLRFDTSFPSFGAPLFPVLSGRKTIVLPAGGSFSVSVYQIVSEDIESLLRAVSLTKSNSYFKQALTASYSYCKLHSISRRFSDLFSAIYYRKQISKHEFGTRPLVTIEVGEGRQWLKDTFYDLKIVQSFVEFEVAILYKETPGYYRNSFDKINYYIEQSGLKHVHVINTFLEGERANKLRESAVKEVIFYKMHPEKKGQASYKNIPITPPQYDLQLGMSGFLRDSSYFIKNNFEHRPWSNVIGSEGIGTIITDNGGGYTFYKNSGTNKITYWSNDALNDIPSEGIILTDGDEKWSISKKPLTKECEYFCRHGFGFTEFTCNFNGIIATQTVFTDQNNKKFQQIKLRNFQNETRTIDLTMFLNLVMGDNREQSSGYISIDASAQGTMVKNALNNTSIFCSASQEIKYYIWDKQQHFIDNYAKESKYTDLSGVLEYPSLAMAVEVTLPALSHKEVVFCIHAQPQETIDSEDLKKAARAALIQSQNYYSNCSAVKVTTKDKATNHLLKWLPYQMLSCRFFARAGFYQAGGAIGFRDQLQDCLSLLHHDPKIVKRHILDCAAHQFEEGDVMHWWHPPMTGVRTRITDDLLYLPWVTAEYIRFTGDRNILEEMVPFVRGRKLKAGEHDLYFTPKTGEVATLFEHCIRAIKYNKFAPNGLLFMGGGDWNDAMDKVGILGKGTSVWCSMFLYFVINKFLPHVKDSTLKNELLETSLSLKEAVEKCWDGQWFLRAFMDNDTVLGSSKSSECSIDLISQTWASLSEIADKKHIKTALKSAADRLIDFQGGVIKLLDPPFEYINAGYICKYPKGVRENGGQYTHAAVWFIMALLKEDCSDFAFSLLEMLNPINRCKTESGRKRYMTEPYVLCGDVYSGEKAGVGGWSWYTGAAGWYYKCFIDDVLGIKINGKRIYFQPKLPQKLNEVMVRYKTEFGDLDITIDNSGLGDWSIFVGKVKYNINYLLISPSLINKKITIKKC